MRVGGLAGRLGEFIKRSGRGLVGGIAGQLGVPAQLELQEVLQIADHIDLLARLVAGPPQVAQQVVGTVQ